MNHSELIKKAGMRWTAVHTRARCEKVVARFCEVNELPYYLPLRRQAKRYQRRTIENWIPMFKGYIFVQISDDGYQVLIKSNKVANILPVNAVEEDKLISELQDIQKMEELSRQEELIVQPEVEVGKQVRVISGPLQGATGVVQKRGQKMRVTVNLDILGQSVSAELDLGDVETDSD